MKKTISVLTAGICAAMLCTSAFAGTIEPGHTIDMESDLNGCDLTVGFEISDVTDREISFNVYSMLVYDASSVEALKEGDVIVTGQGEVTIETLEKYDDVVFVNIDMDTPVSLFEIDADTGYVLMAEEYPYYEIVGQVTMPLAQMITINSIAMDNEGEYQLASADVSAADLDEALYEIAAELYVGFDPVVTKIHVENNTVTEINIG